MGKGEGASNYSTPDARLALYPWKLGRDLVDFPFHIGYLMVCSVRYRYFDDDFKRISQNLSGDWLDFFHFFCRIP